MKKLLSGVKRAISFGPSNRGSGSRSRDNRSQDSPLSSSFVPLLHGTVGSSHYLAHDDIPEATDSDDISIRTTEEMERYEFLCHREFAHTHVYDVNLLERVGMDEELPLILRTIGWGNSTMSRAVEGIGWLERQMDDFAHVQMEMQASIDS
jgi:hypothetical protein